MVNWSHGRNISVKGPGGPKMLSSWWPRSSAWDSTERKRPRDYTAPKSTQTHPKLYLTKPLCGSLSSHMDMIKPSHRSRNCALLWMDKTHTVLWHSTMLIKTFKKFILLVINRGKHTRINICSLPATWYKTWKLIFQFFVKIKWIRGVLRRAPLMIKSHCLHSMLTLAFDLPDILLHIEDRQDWTTTCHSFFKSPYVLHLEK